VKVQGRLLEDGSGEIRFASYMGSGPGRWSKVPAAATHGGMLTKMRTAAERFARDLDPDDEFEFEMLDETEDEQPSVSKGQVDPKLVAPAKLQARRASGEHLCFFCAHEPICAIAGASRTHAQALVVIAGCAQFSMVSGS
jgi:hypothetical protein